MKTIKGKIVMMALMLCVSLTCLANPSEGDGLDGVDGTEAVPLDGGVSLLIAAGVGYGIKKVRDDRKQKNKAAGSS